MTDEFIQHRRYLTGVSPRTVDWYTNSFRQFAGALDSKSTVINRIAELKERGTSHITINSYLRCVNAYFRWLHTEHEKPLLKIPRLKEEQKVLATLTPEHVRALVQHRPMKKYLARARLIALTILDTGLRANELLSLTRDAVDYDNMVLKVNGKGGKQRLVPFSAELRKSLYRHAAATDKTGGRLLFGTKNQTKIGIHNLDREFKVLGRELGIIGVRFSPHTLRHSFAVGYLRNGGNLEYLRRILGHSSISTTQKYLRSLGVEDLGAVHSSFSPLSARR